MSVERIARAVDRLAKGFVSHGLEMRSPVARQMMADMRERFSSGRVQFGEIVDVNAIYHDWKTGNHPDFLPYSDTMMAPPYDEATYCAYQPEGSGYVWMMGASSYTREHPAWDTFRWSRHDSAYESWERSNRAALLGEPDVDWDQVKWITATALYLAFDGAPGVIGPVASWRVAIDEHGTPVDIHETRSVIARQDEGTYDNQMTVWMKATTWLNCRNIELVEPTRPWAQQKRLNRIGAGPIKEIHIRPVGRTVQRGKTVAVGDTATPLHTVRGHMATYGMDGRGKLFGRLTGRYWIPAHARGSAEHGESHPTRVLETS